MPPKAVDQQDRARLFEEQESAWRAASKRPAGLLLMCVGWPLGVVLLLAGYRELLLGAGLSGAGLAAVLLLFVPFGMFLTTGATTWVLGVVAAARRRVPNALHWPAAGSVADVTVQTAIVYPIKNEDTAQVFANVAAIRESLQEAGAERFFDIYVVSNSDDPNCWVEEELAWQSVSSRSGGIYYWRRHRKEGKKPANIAEFCERWGSRYEYMVVLDADSLMSADCLVTLVGLMEYNPQSALMQTAPNIIKGQTLWARLQQFTLWSNGRIVQWGERVWQGAAGAYYGHNAIIRIAPFMKHCGLPHLPGTPPFGGDILSHDFVEAALLSRAGWEVWLVPELEGSYEECPTTLEEHFRRDRRWFQGDFVNLRLLATPKLPPAGRVRFVMSALRDMSPPLLPVLCGLIVGLSDSPAFAASAIFFPFLVWDFSCRQSWAGVPAIGFGISVYTRSVTQQGLPVLRSFCNRILDQVLWLITAPIRLLTYAMFVVEIACGQDAGWTTMRRSAHRATLSQSIRIYCPHTVIGVTVLAVLIFTDSWAVWWLAPVLLSWILTVPLTLAFGSRRIGALARRAGVLLTPEENAPPPIMTRSQELSAVIRQELPHQAWRAALTEETAMAVHQAFLAHGAPLTPQDQESAMAAAAKYRAGTASAGNETTLTDAEKMALLRNPERVWRDTPPPTPVIRYPAALPTRMPEQQLTRRHCDQLDENKHKMWESCSPDA
jgi:membrane glycosyltransferase